MLDCFTSGQTRRLCPEGPVPVVDGCSTTHFAGAAANTAVNVRALGAQVSLIAFVGIDEAGQSVTQLLTEQGVNVDHLFATPSCTTLSKHRVFAGRQILLRFDHGTRAALPPAEERRFLDALAADCQAAHLVIVSDYAYGVLSDAAIACLKYEINRERTVLALDSKRLSALAGLQATVAKPNYGEALELLGLSHDPQSNRSSLIVSHRSELLRRTGARIVAATLDEDGAVVLEGPARPYRTMTKRVPNCQAAGAGDTYLAAFGLAIAAGASANAAAEVAAAAAGVVVAHDHTAVCTADELLQSLSGKSSPSGWGGLQAQIARHRTAGRRIVLTTGCFDILHRGHVTYLQRAKSLGDILVVGVNSDSSIQRLKGPDRPINCLDDRLGVLAGLGCVDHLAAFDELTPEQLIRAIRPDVFVKGGDYRRETLPEAQAVEELGGRVIILPYLRDHSTSEIVARIRDRREIPLRSSPAGDGNGRAVDLWQRNGEANHGQLPLGPRTKRALH